MLSKLRCAGVVAAAACCVGVAGDLPAANAGACFTADPNFELGVTNACATSNTYLTGTASIQLWVSNAVNGNGIAIYGEQTDATAQSSGAAGVAGRAASTNANSFGVSGSALAGTGVVGQHSSSTGTAPGVLGTTSSTDPNSVGVKGTAASANGVIGISQSSVASGVYGENFSGGFGVAGRSNGSTMGGKNMAVFGELTSGSPVADATAVRGENHGTNGNGYGVWGSHAGSGAGVLGQSASGVGVVGSAQNGVGILGYRPGGFAGAFVGNVAVTGTLTKGAGAFRIDHPLDPAHEYLQHSFVESPDMLDVYSGNATTNRRGFATVRLPAYFQALNRSFRYQLTIVGTRGWRARVVREIARNRFTIQTDEPRAKVSWQVTGIRHDAYANAHRIRTVVRKAAAEQGRYLHPELFGRPRSLGVLPLLADAAISTRG
jgi:hypothetical protein